MILDTHEAVEKMVEAGASKKMAEAIVKTLNSSNDNLATKADLLQTKTELKAEISELKSELKEDIANLKTEFKGDIFALKGEIIEMKNNFKWVMALMFAMLGLLVKIAFFG